MCYKTSFYTRLKFGKILVTHDKINLLCTQKVTTMQVDVKVIKKRQPHVDERPWENFWFHKEKLFYSFHTKVLVDVRLSGGRLDVRVHIEALDNCRSMRRPKSKYYVRIKEIHCNISIHIFIPNVIEDLNLDNEPVSPISIMYDPFESNSNGFSRQHMAKYRVDGYIVCAKLFIFRETLIGHARGLGEIQRDHHSLMRRRRVYRWLYRIWRHDDLED
jgi:hypothetical protein